MSSHLVPVDLGGPSKLLAKSTLHQEDLSAGITAAFPIMSYKGKNWRYKFRGAETVLMRADGTGPVATIEVVIVRAAPVISKIWYEAGFVEGDASPPDCWSVNGVRPDPASSKKQSETCAGCRMNMWGSRLTAQGKPGKACSDSKRLAISPQNDIKNEAGGGTILLRTPAASLAELAQYGTALRAQGYDYFGVVTQIGFDVQEAFPKLTFKALRSLNDAEVADMLTMQEHPQTIRMISEAVEQVRAEPEGAPVAGLGPHTAYRQAEPGPTLQSAVGALLAPQPPLPPVQQATSQPSMVAPGVPSFGTPPQAAATATGQLPVTAQPVMTVPARGSVEEANQGAGPIPAFLDKRPAPHVGVAMETPEQAEIRKLQEQIAKLQSAAPIATVTRRGRGPGRPKEGTGQPSPAPTPTPLEQQIAVAQTEHVDEPSDATTDAALQSLDEKLKGLI